MNPSDRFVGCLIGTALGDSLLLPAEGLTRAKIAKRFAGPLRQRLVLGRSMVSDDTEHAFLTAQALLAAGDDSQGFAKALAFRLRWWLIALPGGCGKATARGLIRSWLGFSPSKSGVRSAGNGPAMRSAILGLRWADDPERLRAFVTASTYITHRDDRALTAALAVAVTAAAIARGEEITGLLKKLQEISSDPTWQNLIILMQTQYQAGASVDAFAIALGCPEYVSGYAFHSVPVALYAWMRHRGDPFACLTAILRCGGDTDTIGAIAGALIGCDSGVAAFPSDWTQRLMEWPLSLERLQVVGLALGRSDACPVFWCWPLQPLRNIVFLAIILAHGFRRFFPC